MLTLQSSPHSRTSRNIKSFHACPTSTGLPMDHVDVQRVYREEIALANRTIRRFWLARRWKNHLKRYRQRKEQ